jgi:hypothetical protein
MKHCATLEIGDEGFIEQELSNKTAENTDPYLVTLVSSHFPAFFGIMLIWRLPGNIDS